LRARRAPQPSRRDGAPRESRIAAVALLAIVVVTALVIAAWKFGGPEGEAVPGLATGADSAAQAPKPRGTAHLVVRASQGSSWMEVRATSSSGKLLYSGTLEQGQRKSFDGKSLQIALAKPQNVVVRVNGNRVELPQGTTFVVTSQRVVRAPS
jgi:hypothetical protein